MMEEEMSTVSAPMSGTIVKVLVSVGDSVDEDQKLIVIDAMKMDTPIYAPCKGIIKEVSVKENDKVEADQVLVVLE